MAARGARERAWMERTAKASATVSTVATAAATSAAAGSRLGDADVAAVEVSAVHAGQGLVAVALVGEGNEAETAAAARLSVHHDLDSES